MNKILLIIINVIFLNNILFAQDEYNNEKKLTRILFILDGSQSMLTKWETGTKMEVATDILSNMVDSLGNIDDVEMALRVYGHQKPVPPQNCNDTKLEVPFSKHNIKKIKNKLQSIRPKGTTPIAHSLELSINDFPNCDNCRNVIILITDGIESCDGDPCAVSLRLQKKGIILKPFVIGVGLDEQFRQTFDCVGRYYNASNRERFKEILNVVVSQALNTTTVQVNLLDSYNKPTETDVNMTFYDTFSGEMLYNFIHTINHKGNPDTLSIDPIPTYKLQIHTLPEIWLDSIEISPGEHNIISQKAPQGKLIIKTQNKAYNKELHFIVRQKDSINILNVQHVNTEEKYLVGNYSIEILTIPRLKIDNIAIKQSRTSKILIPEPGLITFYGASNAYGAIYKKDGNKLVRIYNLRTDTRIQTIKMLPGSYIVISRPKNAKESAFTSNISFNVKSNITDKIVLF
jgi:Ca-activated chloride channel family protein